MAGSVILAAADFVVVATGPHADVRLSPLAKVEYDKVRDGTHELAIRQFRELERYMARFCESSTPSFGPGQYRKEDNLSDGQGGKAAVYEFKPRKWRLYGAILKVNEKKYFVGVRVDPAKKQDKADMKALRLTALDIGNLKEYREA